MRLDPCAAKQISLFPESSLDTPLNQRKVKLYNLDQYDIILVSYSGGKDSLNIILWLLEVGVSPEKIRIWHQGVDGAPGSALFMDWPMTEQYVIATAKALGIQVNFQWRLGGFKGELLRENARTANVQFIYQGNIITLPTTKGEYSTRRRFPAKSANLAVRYCSASLKIDVFSRSLNNHPDFKGNLSNPIKILVLTGERREESPARSKYLEAEEHRCNTKSRIVHHFRPVINYTEDQVWQLIERYKITPHPAYLLGYGRTSCWG